MERLKPDPIPAIHPVAEAEAKGHLAEVYARTKEGFSVPWMGVVAMCFAHYPTFYDRLWSALEPAVKTQSFQSACAKLRKEAETQARALVSASIVPELRDAGYTEADLAEIKAVNEIFSAGNMPYLLMATFARQLLEGTEWDSVEVAGEPVTSASTRHQIPVLIEPHHANEELGALYADIRTTLGLPFVNTDYRAFARWPSYFAQAWSNLAPHVSTPAYEAAVAKVHDYANALVAGLPNPTGLTSAALIGAAKQDATHHDVLAVVRLFQWLLPGLAINVAVFRAQLDSSAA